MFRLIRSLAVAAIAMAATASFAQQFPARTVRILVAQPPGGTIDVTARVLASALNARWGQAVVVENKPGAGGTIGSEAVAKAPADGYTLMVSAAAQHTINPWLYSGLSFDPIEDFTPIAMIGNTPMVLAVKPSSLLNSVTQFLEQAKSRNPPMTYSSAGTGTYNHLAGAQLAIKAKIKLEHIPYRGVAPALADVVGGHVDSTIGTVPSIQPFIKAGTLTPLAVTTARRSKALPDVPTLAESGLAGYDIAVRVALFAPARLPKDVVSRINADIGEVLKLPNVVETLSRQGLEIDFTSPAELDKVMRAEAEEWGRTIRQLGIKIE